MPRPLGLPDGVAVSTVRDVERAHTSPLSAYQAMIAAGDLKPDPEQERVMRRLERLHDALVDYPEIAGRTLSIRNWRLSNLLGRPGRTAPEGVYLYGGVGRGKSMVMDLFFEHAPVANKRRVHFHAFMRDVHAQLKAWREMSDQDRIKAGGHAGEDDPIPPVARQIAQQATLLCFDEFQVTDVADAMILGRLYQALLDRGVVIVSTSNRIPDMLYEGGLNRQLFLPFIELIKQRMDVVALDGPTDYRLDRVAGMASYLTPVTVETTCGLQEIFWRLTGLSPDDRSTVPTGQLTVQGRTIFVPKAVDGVAVFSFKRLCANPLGAADYLAIAERFHTVFVVAIPRMGPERRNEAKRFVTLIDALYEARTRLFCSAEAPPDALYPAGDGAFEFERTASRLIEMQSDDYLQHGRP